MTKISKIKILSFLSLSLLLLISSCMPRKMSEEKLRECKVYHKIEKIAVDMDPSENKHIDWEEYMDYLTWLYDEVAIACTWQANKAIRYFKK